MPSIDGFFQKKLYLCTRKKTNFNLKSMFFEQIPAEFILFFLLYGGAAMTALIAGIYLCLRKGNAFAPDITPPLVLRRWAAAFFGAVFMSHFWWALFYICSNDFNSVSCAVVAVIDYMSLLTTISGMLFAMLQDRRRPVWPIVMGTIPYGVFLALNVAWPGGLFLNIAVAYLLLFYLAFTVYMVFAVRQYGRWLRDNYADLEHKEVWASHVLVIVILLILIIDGFNFGNLIVGYLVQFIEFAFFGFLLWRIETLPQLENVATEQTGCPMAEEPFQEPFHPTHARQPLTIPSNIEQLLEERCVGTQLYLQHDLTLLQLARAIGTNRFYLSQFFSRQGITYNAYINDLRINHFMRLYREATEAGQSITAQHLASDSGYRSYSTFGLAFKQRMGKSVTAWMRNPAK